MIVPEEVRRVEVVCVPFISLEDGSGVALVPSSVNVSDGISDETPLDNAVVNVAFVEEYLSNVKLSPIVSEVGIAALTEGVAKEEATDVRCCDETD